jgi:hypothetical protein
MKVWCITSKEPLWDVNCLCMRSTGWLLINSVEVLAPHCWLVFLFWWGNLTCHVLMLTSLLCVQSRAGPEVRTKVVTCYQIGILHISGAVMHDYGALVQWWLAGENQRTWRETCFSNIFVCHKSHMTYSWLEFWLLWWESTSECLSCRTEMLWDMNITFIIKIHKMLCLNC